MYSLPDKERKGMDQSSLSLNKRHICLSSQWSVQKLGHVFFRRNGLKPLPNQIKSKNGQILVETLFVIIILLIFLSAVQFFQSVAKKEIQKQRLTKEKFYKTKNPKHPWMK